MLLLFESSLGPTGKCMCGTLGHRPSLCSNTKLGFEVPNKRQSLHVTVAACLIPLHPDNYYLAEKMSGTCMVARMQMGRLMSAIRPQLDDGTILSFPPVSREMHRHAAGPTQLAKQTARSSRTAAKNATLWLQILRRYAGPCIGL